MTVLSEDSANALIDKLGHTELSEADCYIIEAAYQKGFQIADSNGDYLKVSERDLVAFVRMFCPRAYLEPNAHGWLPMETAPKDSTIIRLLVEFEEHSFEDDNSTPQPTIGTNHLNNTGADEWLFAGWCWTHDRFTQGVGKPIGWLPMIGTQPTLTTPPGTQPAAHPAPAPASSGVVTGQWTGLRDSVPGEAPRFSDGGFVESPAPVARRMFWLFGSRNKTE
jgi:hypothetical protein